MTKKKRNAPISNLNDSLLKKARVTRFPSPICINKKRLTAEKKIEEISIRFKEIMELLGLDLSDDSLAETPNRIAKMYVNEIFSGLVEENFPRITFMQNKVHHHSQSSLVVVKSSFTSFCEHHFVPMSGEAYIAFIPKKKLIGLSKIPRVIRYFAKRPQLQERLTAQIADSLSILLETDDIAVSVTAKHYCVLARGVEDHVNNTTTLLLRGQFEKNEARKHEFFEMTRVRNHFSDSSSSNCEDCK